MNTAVTQGTYNADTREFSFIDGLPKRVQKRIEKGVDALRDAIEQYEAAQAIHGTLLPVGTIAESLGVSHQRVGTLMAEGRLQAVDVAGRRYVAADSAMSYIADGPRRPGRPRKEVAA